MNLPQKVIWKEGAEVWARMKSRHIFLTGGTGFFGRSLLELVGALNREKDLDLNVTILTRSASDFQKNWPALASVEWVRFHEGSLIDFAFPQQSFGQILHFATPVHSQNNFENSKELLELAVAGTQHLMEFAVRSKAKTVLFASSGAVYGPQPYDIEKVPETYMGAPPTDRMTSAYGEAKRVSELLGNLYAQNYGFDFKIARCFALAGPHLDKTGKFAFGNFIRDAQAGNVIQVAGDGSARRSYLYSDDLILWLFKILLDGRNGAPYNVGSDQSISILELAKLIAKLVNPNAQVQVAKTADPFARFERYVPATELARSELGLQSWTSLEQAILETAKGYELPAQ